MTAFSAAKGHCSIPVTGALLFAGGEMGSLLNPEGASVIITRATLYTATPTTGAAVNISIGTAADAVTSSTNLTNASNADDAAGSAYNCLAYGDPADALVVWTSAQYVTCTGSADSTGFTGRLYLEYIHV